MSEVGFNCVEIVSMLFKFCRYSVLVKEVLHSVCKTEESLRRLKSRNVNPADDSSSNSRGDLSSDESKIREQIKLDVKYFVTHVSFLQDSR